MQKPIIQQPWTFKDRKFRVDIYDSNDFTNLSPIKQVYALLINDKKEIAAAYNKSDMWILPGGGTEKGESPLDTLVREIKEETNCDIDPTKAKPFFYQEQIEITKEGEVSQGFQLRYIVPVLKYHKFVSDPDDNDITDVKWASLEDSGKYLGWWGKTYEYMLEKLPTLLKDL